ncbi:MAG: phospholipase D/Transphosphatidylase [Bryobacterales bacterium]|nr:phospholipase D/Transphosphatidylase [Bryobacterales bacterium]
MSNLGSIPSPGSSAKKPKESRRWLKPRVPKEQLYRLSPRRPKPERLGRLERWDRVRRAIRTWWIWLAVAIAAYLTGYWIVTLIAGVLSFVFYHTAPESHPAVYALETDLDVESTEFPITMEGMTGMPLVPGNQIALFNNGDEFYPKMLEAIESAQHSITMEQYIFWDGRVGRRFAEAFAEKARAGVPVKLLLDAIGSSTLGEIVLKILEAGGCQLAWFRPIHWYTIVRANHRDHRKSLIIDGKVAFTGGAGLADHWLGQAKNVRSWRDVMIRVEGPAALVQQSGFAQNWLQCTGEILTGHEYFPVPSPAGNVDIQTILSSPFEGIGTAGTMHLIALQCARRHIYIANPYFIPDARLIDMLARAQARGVAVKLMLAGKHNDTWWARQNSLRLYGKLLEAGVEIFEFLPTMLHQKIVIVDDAWASVGTANFDNRSLALNEETSLCFHDRALVNRLHDIFIADLERCRKVRLADWKRRGFWQRAGEQFASLIEDQV